MQASALTFLALLASTARAVLAVEEGAAVLNPCSFVDSIKYETVYTPENDKVAALTSKHAHLNSGCNKHGHFLEDATKSSSGHGSYTTIQVSPPDTPTSASGGVEKDTKRESKYPFTRIVAFGDNLSDNGNGSYAHGVVDLHDPNNTIYGHRTWTNGPVAVSYLADHLGIPLASDYAFGHALGGSHIGATINNSYTPSEYAPDAFTQLANYTSTSCLHGVISTTLHFLWIGNNDINMLHIATGSWDNAPFAEQMSHQVAELVRRLIAAGARHVFVPGLYAKHISPSWHFYARNEGGRRKLGHAIAQANAMIDATLRAEFGDAVLYYDVFGFMLHIWNNHAEYGITHVDGEFCDGYSAEDWDLCVTQGKGDEFYWMQYLDMTTRVHALVAEDMFRAINARLGV